MSHNINKKKEKETLYFQDIPLTKETLLSALYVIAIIVAIVILIDAIKISNRVPASISLYFLCICIYYYHITKLNNSKNLYKKVAWIAEKEHPNKYSKLRLRDFKLTEYIEIEQNNQNIPDEFRIDFSNETEKEYLNTILNNHREHVIKSYFYGWLNESKQIYNLDSLEYYFFSLQCFVYDNLSNYKDNGAYEKEEYISDWQFKCQLTEYGRIYYKLDLITYTYVVNNKKTLKAFKYIDTTRKNYIMEILEKNEACFFNYRP